MRTEAHAPGRLFGRHAGAQREAPADALGSRHDVRLHAVMFIGVKLSGPRHAALHFIEHQHQIVFVAQGLQAANEFVRRGADAAFALDRLDQETGSLVGDKGLCAFEIVEFRILESGEQGHETLVHLFLIGRADRRHCAPVKGVGEGDQLGAVGVAIFMLVIGARGLDRRFYGFRARIGEEHGVCESLVDQPLRQCLTLWAAVEVGDMHQCLGLFLDRADQAFVAVPEQIDCDAAGEIQIARAVLVDQMAVIARDRAHAAAGINGHQRADRHSQDSPHEYQRQMAAPEREPPSACLPAIYSFMRRWSNGSGRSGHLPYSAGTRLTAEYLPRRSTSRSNS